MILRGFSFICIIGSVFCAATSKHDGHDDKKDRVLHNELKSDETHYEHNDEEHNPEYDHDAFLGEDEARSFDQLTPEESKQRLSIIVDKIDSNNDTLITEEELKQWIEYTQKRYIHEDVKRQWDSNNPNNNEKLSWEQYKNVVYGFIDNLDDQDESNDDDGMSYKDMIQRDQRRWSRADDDKDESLTLEEFTAFLHPEEVLHMRDLVIQETMEDIDKDQDGKISLAEYIGDMFKGDEEEEPSWVGVERAQFNQFRDVNKDGFMDEEEVKAWIIPSDYDYADAEAKHLIFESDTDGDKQLNKKEIIDKYDLFVGSQATDYGEALVRHDEF